jgi:hypothetical protein
MFSMSSQIKKFSQCELRDKKHQHFSTVSLPTDSVIVDHTVSRKGTFEEHEFPKSTFAGIEELFGIRLVYSFVIGIILRNF